MTQLTHPVAQVAHPVEEDHTARVSAASASDAGRDGAWPPGVRIVLWSTEVMSVPNVLSAIHRA